jgi:hypothetical protein
MVFQTESEELCTSIKAEARRMAFRKQSQRLIQSNASIFSTVLFKPLCTCLSVYMTASGILCILLDTDPEVRVRFLALPDFMRSSGSGTGTTEKLLERKNSGPGLESREYARRDPSR